ncbi:MAG: hypothetical protein FWE61_11115 [Micrococcales bacterium]|nr:hypothetical protein [Micrococcales bacterium]
MSAVSLWSAVFRPERPRGGGRGTWFTIAGLVLVPLTIGALLTWALWKPTEHLDRMTAAVVNADTGVQVDGRPLILGRLLAAGLVTSPADGSANISGHTSSANLTWEITNAADAASGLASGAYVAVVEIGEDFSATAMSWTTPGTTDAQQAQVTLRTSPRARPLDAVIAATITSTASQVLGVRLTQGYLDGVLTGFTTIGSELGTAADGAGQLASGTGTAAQGATGLADGAGQLADGAGELRSGAGSLATGAGTLASGTKGLAEGVNGLSGGTTSLADALAQLSGQTSAAAGAAEQGLPGALLLVAGAAQLATAVNGTSPGDPASLSTAASALAAGASGLAGGVHQSSAGANDLAGALAAANQGLGTFLTTASGLAQACQADPSPGGPCQQLIALIASQQAGNPAGLSDNLAAARAGAGTLATNMTTMDAAAGQVAAGAQQVNQAVNTGLVLPDGTNVPALSTATGSLAAGANALLAGVTGSATGLATLDGYVRESAAGAATLASGASGLASGADDLAAGAAAAATGTNELFNATSRLAARTGDLAGGARELADSVAELAPGATSLADALRDASGSVGSYSPQEAAQLAAVIADPVVTTGADVDLFGSSVVPYFMVLALWLGALAAFVVLTPTTPRALGSTNPSWRLALGSFAPAAAVGVVQGVGLAAVLAGPLGLSAGTWVRVALLAAGVGVAFAAVNQGLAAAFGGTGRFVGALVATIALAAAVVSTVPQAVLDLYGGSPLGPALAGLQDAAGTGPIVGPVFVLAAWTLGGLGLTTAALARHRVVPAGTLARWGRTG